MNFADRRGLGSNTFNAEFIDTEQLLKARKQLNALSRELLTLFQV